MPTNASAGKLSLMSVDHALAAILAGLQPTATETPPHCYGFGLSPCQRLDGMPHAAATGGVGDGWLCRSGCRC